MLSEALGRAARLERLALPAGQEGLLAQAWASLPVFRETAGVLASLRGAGWRLAVLTNCDDDLFALTAPSFGVGWTRS